MCGVVLVDDVPRGILDSRIGARVAVLFDGCTRREDAEALRGAWLHVDVDEAVETPADPDEFYDHQLEGLDVVIEGQRVGTIAEVLHLPGHDVLAVDRDDAPQVLVPFVEQIVPVVDVAAGRIEVRPVAGLFDDAD